MGLGLFTKTPIFRSKLFSNASRNFSRHSVTMFKLFPVFTNLTFPTPAINGVRLTFFGDFGKAIFSDTMSKQAKFSWGLRPQTPNVLVIFANLQCIFENFPFMYGGSGERSLQEQSTDFKGNFDIFRQTVSYIQEDGKKNFQTNFFQNKIKKKTF